MNPYDRCCDGLARNLIQHAARKAPPSLSERLGEEWLADLTARPGAFSQLCFALGCYWATTVIAHEFAAPVRAAAAVSGSKTTVLDHTGPGESFSRRTTVILAIVAFHVLVVCILATAIERPKGFKPTTDRIRAEVLPQPRRTPTSLPTNPPLRGFQPEISPPRWTETPTDPPATVRTSDSDAPPPGTAGPPLPRPVSRVLGGPGEGFPNTNDFYPEASRRLGEKGIATVNVCVDGSGRLIGQPAIAQSSGSVRLDEGARRLAQAGSGHYRATTEDGRPVSACYPFRVRFQLRD